MGSIRNQILWPLVTIQVLAVVAITLSATTIAARRAERQIIDRLDGVASALGHATFPFNTTVLTRMRGLSGAHFVGYDDRGRISATTLAKPEELPSWLPSVPRTSRVHSLGSSPTVQVEDARYIAVPLHTSARPSTLLVLYPQASWHQALWEAAL
ncbi:sensor histidine kinase, partial [Singulisphaera rosea]